MISKYKKISIIYGGSGVNCARKIDEYLTKLHDEEFYPLESAVIAKQIMGGANIFKTVKNAISSSTLCIIILTFDDLQNTRIRQNVLVEIGMALMTVENTDNCIFLSEKTPLPDDFPSDLKGWINPNYFDKDNLEEVAQKVCDEVKVLLKCKPHKNLLSAGNYIFDYENILNDIPNNVFEEKADIQLEHILYCWQESIASFSFVSERIMYLMERIKFFPDFNSNENFFRFLKTVRNLIKPGEADYDMYDAAYINTVCSLATAILDYTDIKLRKEVIKCMDNPQADTKAAEEYGLRFSSIVNNIQKFVDKTENNSSVYNYNWLLKTIAYEYLGLAKMKVINFRNKYDESILPTLDYVIECYKKVICLADDYGGTSAILWRGYTEYNLTRVYEIIYKITNDVKYLEYIKSYSLSSIATRKEWCKVNSFKGVFTSALSFEYFLVKKHELEIRYRIKEYSSSTKEQLIEEISSLDEELKQYCDSIELGRLYDMKSSLDEFRKKIKN